MDYLVEVHQSGRITIPAAIRKALHVSKGDVLTIRQEDDGIRIITPQQAMEQARELAAPYLGEHSSVDDFLQWRKAAWQDVSTHDADAEGTA